MIRHAKSSWATIGQDDFDRPLNERGLQDAPMMARRLLEKKIGIDVLLSSSAKRAHTTAKLFAVEYGLGNDRIVTSKKLYHAGPETFFEVIGSLDDSLRTLAVFSHNPGITSFVNMLTDARIDNMPTCAVFAIKTTADRWAALKKADNHFWFFDYPKM